MDPDGRFSKANEISVTNRKLSWDDFATTRDKQKNKQDTRDTINVFLGWIANTISVFFGGSLVGDIVDTASTLDGFLSVRPDNLNKLNSELQEVSNKVADISQATGKVPTVEITEVTTLTAINEDVESIGGAALVSSMMEHRIIEKTILEIKINGVLQTPIVVSEEQIFTSYERSLNYDDFSWVQ